MNNLQRLLVGGLGGLAAVLVRYLSRDHDTVLLLIESDIPLAAKEFRKLWAGYLVFTPIMILLGAMIGWISEETHKVKLFALGVSAPALITTYSAAQPEKRVAFEPGFISYAYANPSGQRYDSEIKARSSEILISEENNFPLKLAQLREFFGNSDSPVYLVQVGSFIDKTKANQLAARINKEGTSIRAFVSELGSSGGVMYRVLVAQGLSLRDALLVRRNLQASGIVKDAFLKDVNSLDDPLSSQ